MFESHTVDSSPMSGLPPPVPPAVRPAVITLQTLIDAYLQEYEVRQFRINIARCRVVHLRSAANWAVPSCRRRRRGTLSR